MMGHGKPLKAIRGTGEPAPLDARAGASRVWESGQEAPAGTEPISMTWPQHQRRECRVGKRYVALSPHERSLLLALLVRRQSVSKDELIEALWPDPDLEPDYAYDQVNVHVSHLRAKGVGLITRYGFVRLAERHRFA